MRAIWREQGFTLLEVLVALAVLGVGTALTLSVISGALGNIRKVQLRARSVQHAESVMEITLLDDSIKRATSLHGDFEDGTTWTAVVTEVEAPAPPVPTPAPGLNLQGVQMPVLMLAYTVEVMEPGSRVPDFRLRTLKLVGIQDPRMPVQGAR